MNLPTTVIATFSLNMIGAVHFLEGTLSALSKNNPDLLYALLEKVRDHCIAHAPESERMSLLTARSRLASPTLDSIGRLINDILWVNLQVVQDHGATWEINPTEAAAFVFGNSPLWDAAIDDGLVIHDDPTTTLVAGTSELAAILKPLKRALHGQEAISIFDPFVARKLYSGEESTSATLKVLANFLRREDRPTPMITLQSFWDTAKGDWPEFFPARMQNVLERFAEEANVRISVELKAHNHSDGTRKWHGRYLVLSGKWVIQTDTGCDFVVPNRNAMTRIQPNEFFRWDVGQYRPERLQSRYSSYPSVHPKLSAQPRVPNKTAASLRV